MMLTTVNSVRVVTEEVMGNDLTPVLAAKVSFDADKEEDVGWEVVHFEKFSRKQPILNEKQIGLLNYLARGMSSKEFDNVVESLVGCTDKDKIVKALWDFRRTPTHEAPFGSCFARFTVEAPVFVARQLVKHEYLRMSEVSRRYVKGDPEFFIPDNFNGIAESVKQGSGEPLSPEDNDFVRDLVLGSAIEASGDYKALLSYVSPEEARMILPLCHMTRWVWSGSLDAFANMCNLRLDPHAQSTTRQVAKLISDEMSWAFPESWKALVRDD